MQSVTLKKSNPVLSRIVLAERAVLTQAQQQQKELSCYDPYDRMTTYDRDMGPGGHTQYRDHTKQYCAPQRQGQRKLPAFVLN